MNQFKRVQVIMLPTLKESILLLNPTTNKFGLTKETSRKIYPIEEYIKLGFIPQHLYIISDDEIKEDDWVIHLGNPYFQFKENMRNLLCKECKKVIATTDTSLKQFIYTTMVIDEGDIYQSLPQPSQQFIEKYIEEYNKGNIIIDVLVEYEQDYTNRNCSTCSLGTDGTCELNLEKKCCSSTNNATKHGDYWISCLDGEEDSEIYKIKVTPKDSTITIKKLKDSWNREEVIEQMWSVYKAANTIFEDESALRVEFNNWIDQNL